jgi:CubicO group peptidase (beta-lactamase class C family)
LFAIASNSKLFAALSIGLLIENGTILENGDKLDYNTKIKNILPDWRMLDPYMQDHLDILDLLGMFRLDFKL